MTKRILLFLLIILSFVVIRNSFLSSKKYLIKEAQAQSTTCTNYQFVTKWGSSGSTEGLFRFPIGITTDASGNIYATDSSNNRVQKFNPDGSFSTQWGSQGSLDGQFKSPAGITIDASGYIYVVDQENFRIQKFNPVGSFSKKWGSYGYGVNAGNGQFNYAYGITTDASGNIYVADSGNHRIQKFSSEGIFISKWGSQGSGNGQFSNPKGITTDASGNIYVADSGNHRIQIIHPDGTLTQWGSQGSGDGQFYYPYGITADTSGNIYVADSGNHRIQKFDHDGNFMTKWGSQGSADSQFNEPRDIAVDGSGNIYIVDYINIRIQKFSCSNTSLSPTTTTSPTISSTTPTCSTKAQGDANCVNNVNDDDYTIWRCEFLGGGICSQPPSSFSADFNNPPDGKVDLIDFEIWRQTRYPARPALCDSAVISPSPGILSPGGSLTVTSTAKTNDIIKFHYAFYNLSNLYPPPPDDNAKPICVANPTGAPNVTPTIPPQGSCLSGSHQLVFVAKYDTAKQSNTYTINYSDIDVVDTNWNNQPPKHFSVNAYFTNSLGQFSAPDANCIVRFSIAGAPTITPHPTATTAPTTTVPTTTSHPTATPTPAGIYIYKCTGRSGGYQCVKGGTQSLQQCLKSCQEEPK